MKKISILIVILCNSIYSKAQTVNDKPISKIDVEYIQIVGTNRMLSNKMNIEIDFGQVNKLFVWKDAMIKDRDGKVVIFNSMIDAVNFMAEGGYELVNAYSTNLSNILTFYYILRKKKEVVK